MKGIAYNSFKEDEMNCIQSLLKKMKGIAYNFFKEGEMNCIQSL